MMDKVKIVEAQRSFFDTGTTLDVGYRIEALKKLLNALTKHEDMLLSALRQDLGKSGFEAYMTEIGMCRDELRFALRHLPKWSRARSVRTPLAQFAAKSFVMPEPYGVSLIISPWNYPVLLSIDPLIGAIAAGNCAVLKPSNYTPATSAALAKIIGDIFPPEYICVVQGGRDANADLLEQRFDYIFFTGSVEVGKVVMTAAAKSLTPVSLELGGKSPAIIDKTADIALTAKRLAFGKFINAGQTCVAPDYVFVHESIKDALVRELVRAIETFYPKGVEDETLPRIVSKRHFERLMGLMQGEKAIIGGVGDSETLKIAPTVLGNITQDSLVMREEIFGPILPLLSFTELDTVIDAVRARPKPLALYVFTKSKAVQKRVLRELSFGGGCINDTIIHLATPHMGFGGVGESGMGAYHGKYSFDTFSHHKSIVDKKTWIDLPIRYAPFTEKKERMLRAFLK